MREIRQAESARIKEMAKTGVKMPKKTRMTQTWKMEHEEGDIMLSCEVSSGGVESKTAVVMECQRVFTLTRWEAEKLAKALVDVKNFGSMI